VLHDATVVEASGTIPQDLMLRLECDYLRERFEPSGGGFLVTLIACSKFEFAPWDESQDVITAIKQIGTLRLWIRSAEPMVDHCKVHCARHVPGAAGGDLRVAARIAELRLDSGRVIPIEEIKQVASDYWEEFSSARDRLS
jgi:hypothetical protein